MNTLLISHSMVKVFFHYRLEDNLHKVYVCLTTSAKSLASLWLASPFFSSVLMPRDSSSFSHQLYRSGCSIVVIGYRWIYGI